MIQVCYWLNDIVHGKVFIVINRYARLFQMTPVIALRGLFQYPMKCIVLRPRQLSKPREIDNLNYLIALKFYRRFDSSDVKSRVKFYSDRTIIYANPASPRLCQMNRLILYQHCHNESYPIKYAHGFLWFDCRAYIINYTWIVWFISQNSPVVAEHHHHHMVGPVLVK